MGTTGGDGPLETCPGDSAPRPQTNILFDGVTFHDVFYSTDLTGCSGDAGGCLEWGASHPDCFEINGYVDGVTIQNSTFYHCGNTMLSLYTDQGDINNVTAQNNTFRDMAPTSYYGIQWVDTAAHTCNNDKFINNTYMPNAPDRLEHATRHPASNASPPTPKPQPSSPATPSRPAHPKPTAPPTPSPPTTRSGRTTRS